MQTLAVMRLMGSGLPPASSLWAGTVETAGAHLWRSLAGIAPLGSVWHIPPIDEQPGSHL
jgi:hypothetical protein